MFFKLIIILLLRFLCVLSIDEFRIIDGEISEDGEFPYAVAYYFSTSDGNYFCGGSLISDSWILTAAHCLPESADFTIIAGVRNLKQAISHGIVSNSSVFIAHPDFDKNTLSNDIGLIKLKSPIVFSELPTKTLGSNEVAIAVGWGLTAENQTTISTDLAYVSLITVSNAVCRRTYGNLIKDNIVCLIGEGKKGICQGDSGGPLVQVTPEGKHVQVGITSFFSAAGCESDHPSGFTRTFEYVEWIKNMTSLSSVSVSSSILASICLLILILLIQ